MLLSGAMDKGATIEELGQRALDCMLLCGVVSLFLLKRQPVRICWLKVQGIVSTGKSLGKHLWGAEGHLVIVWLALMYLN